MPTYEYQCEECRKKIASYYTRAVAAVSECKCDCGGIMHKIISPPTVIVKNPHPHREGRGRG